MMPTSVSCCPKSGRVASTPDAFFSLSTFTSSSTSPSLSFRPPFHYNHHSLVASCPKRNTHSRRQSRTKELSVKCSLSEPLKVMISGAPASGKGTQCQLIVEKVIFFSVLVILHKFHLFSVLLWT
uniref:Uncharacterized protein MANES_14G139700 n=1 Tax=Rhizophora mucronata TaxID=61149 RepID=A0A2P2LVV9_RHIMU